VIIATSEGRRLHAGSTRPVVKIGPHVGARLLGVIESEVAPGGGFPPHLHEDYEEAFYVVAGDMTYLTDGEWVTAPPGTMVYAAAGAVHGFRNDTDVAARHLAITSPAIAVTMVEDLLNVKPQEWPDVLMRYGSRLER
jgi:quercetin dioxygenase-like cupin family protein